MTTARTALAATLMAIAVVGLVHAEPKSVVGTKVIVYKTASCGCCKKWVDYLRIGGFDVEAKDVSSTEVRAVSKAAGLSDKYASCHTAKIGKYVVEGHVPTSAIKRMLLEKPPIAGIAVPGMPIGSPGMEQGDVKEPYDVIAFVKDGTTSLYSKHK